MTEAPVSALFVQTGGVYFGREGVDPWDEPRNALLYQGADPVIAHPPCSRWCQLAHVNQKRYGHRVGDDGGCFESALANLRRCGGVLEHPAFSYAWPAFDLPRPRGEGWRQDGDLWVCEVWQSAYGHNARKRTWLLYKGARRPFDLRWDRLAGSHWCGNDAKAVNPKPTLSKREASATPTAFAEELIRLAQWSRA